MPSVSPAQHRWIGWLHSNPGALAHSGMSQAKVDEWLHADRGSPWKHRASGGAAKRDTGFHGDWTDWLDTARPKRSLVDPGIYAFPPGGIDKRMEGVYSPDLYQGSDADQGMRGSARGGIVQHRDAGGATNAAPAELAPDPPDYTDQFNTQLSPADETRYQSWVTQRSAAQKRDASKDTFDYDLRGAWKSDAQAAANGHLPDTWKKPNHPTFSTGSQYSGTGGMTGGTWVPKDNSWSYQPSATNLNMYGPEGLREYFRQTEPDSKLMMASPRAFGGTLHRDAGGMVDPTSPSLGGIAPSAQSMTPQTQALVQRYSALPTEKLYELSAQLGATPQGQIVRKVLQQKQAMPQQGMQPTQQQSAGMQQPQGYAGGGAPAISPSMASPWWTRHEAETSARPASGFLAGATAGRADSLKTSAPSGSYVLPADVVAGLGEGNSLAGARVVQDMLSTGPHGIPMPRGGGRSTIPRAPALGDLRQFAAKGGDVQTGAEDATPVALSHGEFVVEPRDVARLGGGDLKRGHRILDAFVVHVRKKHIDKLKQLPGPVGAKKKAA